MVKENPQPVLKPRLIDKAGIKVKKHKIMLSAVTVAALVAGVGFAAPAAAEDPGVEAEQLLSVIESVAPDVLENTASTESTVDDAATYSSELTTVEVPRSADEALSLSGLNRDLQISLPFAEQASDAIITDDGITSFDNNNGSTTVPIVHEDGSLQLLTVIEGPDAPTRYDYEISVPKGGSMDLLESGAVLITDASGNFVGAIVPPWAKDATGKSLPTEYEVNGTTVTQVVEHAQGTKYPVVADPWLGIQLFKFWWTGSWRGDITYNATVTDAGAVVLGGGGGVGGYVAGGIVFRANGWAEWTSRWPAITNKATLGQQFNCHVMAGQIGLLFTGPYNLERAQTNLPSWGNSVFSHHCNWTP